MDYLVDQHLDHFRDGQLFNILYLKAGLIHTWWSLWTYSQIEPLSEHCNSIQSLYPCSIFFMSNRAQLKSASFEPVFDQSTVNIGLCTWHLAWNWVNSGALKHLRKRRRRRSTQTVQLTIIIISSTTCDHHHLTNSPFTIHHPPFTDRSVRRSQKQHAGYVTWVADIST